MSDINDIKRELEALTAKVAAYEATKARNWPERIEAGMVFQSPGTTATWMATDVDGLFVCLKGETDSFKAAGLTMRLERDNVPHAGHARDILAIRTDAHEPTGAELVGRVCMLSKDGISFNACAVVANYNMDKLTYWTDQGHEYKLARLAK